MALHSISPAGAASRARAAAPARLPARLPALSRRSASGGPPAGAGPVAPEPVAATPRDGMGAEAADAAVRDALDLLPGTRRDLTAFRPTPTSRAARAVEPELADLADRAVDDEGGVVEVERRCVSMLAGLWHAPATGRAVGCSAVDSGEAGMVAAVAMMRRWRARRDAGGLPADRPNLVLGAGADIRWTRFCRYWNVEARRAPWADDATRLTGEGAAARCDEQTIGVVATLGSAITGRYDPVEDIAAALDRVAVERGIEVPVHVDAASGGFVAPFVDPDLVWDFRLRRVVSIDGAGDGYGLVRPPVGWVLWRDRSAIPDELVVPAAGPDGPVPTVSLTGAAPAAPVVAQYHTMLRLGVEGYRRVHATCRAVARSLARDVVGAGPFTLVSDGSDLPVVAFRVAPGTEGGGGGRSGGPRRGAPAGPRRARWTAHDLSAALRERGWRVPVVALPPALDDVEVLRVVVGMAVDADLAAALVADIGEVTGRLDGAGVSAFGGARLPRASTG